MDNFFFVPTGSSNHCYYRPSLLHIHFSYTLFVLPLHISMYSIAFTVVSKVTLFLMGQSVTIFFFFCLNNYTLPNFLFVLQCLLTLSSGIGVSLAFFGIYLCILGLHLRPIYSCFIFFQNHIWCTSFIHCYYIIHPRTCCGGGLGLIFC